MDAFEKQLREWLPTQRWYAGGARTIERVAVEQRTELVSGDPSLQLLLLSVEHTGGTDRYQLFLGTRSRLTGRLAHVHIGDGEGGAYYDAAHDSELTDRLLELVAGQAEVGPLRFRSVPGAGPLDVTLHSLAIPHEQTNTSLVYGEEYILKTFRRLVTGTNPDLELHLALVRAGSTHIAEPLGWYETDVDAEPTTLGLLQRFLRTGTDGWLLATGSVRDLYAEADLHADEVGGDFAAESERLGAATAAVHHDLAEALGAEPTGSAAELSRTMREHLAEARREAPSLAVHARAIDERFAAFPDQVDTFTVQRVHGDYHLGQVMRTTDGWVLLDFEGEPEHPLEYRRAKTSPLKDIAGMLRSFDYAAEHLLVEQYGDPQHEYRAREWSARNREAFCVGYADEADTDPREQRALLHAFELDKAVYEVVYESRHRPSWLRIPMNAIERIVGDSD
ncbi:MAG: aminoglycoside phosphotransferase [Streptosporangiales bacterium]|nr:aminoglycoside phosphotransferase [Streptosporangiales bacterium]MBO0889387.1 maltokinase [Acidothermales bacterium]